jgi:hypothetical protein
MRDACAGRLVAALGCLALAADAAGDSRNAAPGPHTLVVCPASDSDAACEFRGGLGIQQAVDRATNGDTILLKAGVYTSQGSRDVTYKIYTIPGFVVIDAKNVEIVGEPGTILDGAGSDPITGIVVNRSRVAIRNVSLKGFTVSSSEDDRYDGHGVFIIDSVATLNGVRMENIAKMGLTVRGDSMVEATGLAVRDGHIGVWLEESAHLTLRDSQLKGNESAGVCAYVNSSARVYDTVIEGNEDDGLYAENDATIYVTGSTITGNRPYGVRAIEDGHIFIEDSRVFANDRNFSRSWFKQRVKRGPGVNETNTQAAGGSSE